MTNYIVNNGDLGGMWNKATEAYFMVVLESQYIPSSVHNFKRLHRFTLSGKIIDFTSSGFASFLTFHYPYVPSSPHSFLLYSSPFPFNVHITVYFRLLCLSALKQLR